MKSTLSVLLLAYGFVATLLSAATETNTIPLAGEWRFQLDPNQQGINAIWFAQNLKDTIRLPGTTDENQKGILTDYRPADRLARVWDWKGAAWYQHSITIPKSWKGKRITLFLERTKHSYLWVNESFISWRDSLSAPHVFDITKAVLYDTAIPLTLLIDNSKLPPVGAAHAIDERTQTNWNGILGRIELHASDPVWIEDVQVFPNAAKREARVVATLGNITGKPIAGTLSVACNSRNVKTPATFATQTIEATAAAGGSTVEFIYQPGGDVPLWDEFHPALLDLDLKLAAGAFTDSRKVSFGMRDFTRNGNRLLINGRPLFLRGRVDSANYPLTGHAPMDHESWRRILQIQKDWGLNHIRFHSWCPPAAAFEVADELGFYLQVELPNKRSAFKTGDEINSSIHNYDYLSPEDSDTNITLFDYAKREGELIFRHYGNSPAFTMFTLGNELGTNDGMAELVAHFKKANPRSLHAQGSNNMHWEPTVPKGDDFWVTTKMGENAKPVRGSYHRHRNPPGHVENASPSTLIDYRASIADVPLPVISHEIGAYQVSPDFKEIDKFTGVLRARNYEIFRERLDKAAMLDQSDAFVKSSGALAAITYREDIEAALRTPEFGGFQLLDIMDFPGQGTAPVGMLDVFMNNKGILQPEQWREFCSETVPLLGMKKYTWINSETFTAKVTVSHYGPKDLTHPHISWAITDADAKTIAGDTLTPTLIATGGPNEVGDFSFPLAGIANAQKLTVTLAIEGTPYRNCYPIWVYPAKVDTKAPGGVLVSRHLGDATTQAHLTKGGRVLLLPELAALPDSVPGAFMTDYWSPMFAQGDRKRGETPPPGTMGILCDPKHPALAAFPTEFHSNWQWWHLVKNARPIILDDTPREYRPLVQVVDNFDRNHKLGLIFETRIGKGSLLVCAIDLPALQDKPEARQLLHSLLNYAASATFAPKQEMRTELLNKLFP